MSYYFDIKEGYIQLIDVLKKLFSIYNIPYTERIEEFVDIRSKNFSEIQDEYLTENLVKLKNLLFEFLDKADQIKDQTLLDNLRITKELLSKIRSNHNYAYYFLKLYWSIQQVLMREKILSDDNYDEDIINYNWILRDELLDFLELIIQEGSLTISSEDYNCLDKKHKDTLLAHNLITIDQNNIKPTTLTKKIIESIEISEFFNYYQYDFDELIHL